MEKLGVDFDYGERYYTGALDYTHIGAYNGGSSLVVAGDLEAENLVRLYKTELDVTAASKMQITYQKPSASDSSEMKLAPDFQRCTGGCRVYCNSRNRNENNFLEDGNG